MLRQLRLQIQHALADLKLQFRNFIHRCIGVEFHLDIHPARFDGGIEIIEIVHLLNFFFDGMNHLIPDLRRRRPWPYHRNHHHLQRDRGVFRPPQSGKSIKTGNHRQ